MVPRPIVKIDVAFTILNNKFDNYVQFYSRQPLRIRFDNSDFGKDRLKLNTTHPRYNLLL